jgi:hypothetical protein
VVFVPVHLGSGYPRGPQRRRPFEHDARFDSIV